MSNLLDVRRHEDGHHVFTFVIHLRSGVDVLLVLWDTTNMCDANCGGGKCVDAG
jgi:hypothetical protein